MRGEGGGELGWRREGGPGHWTDCIVVKGRLSPSHRALWWGGFGWERGGDEISRPENCAFKT